MKILKIDMNVYREDEKDFDESIEDEFVEALVNVIEDFGLLAFLICKIEDVEE